MSFTAAAAALARPLPLAGLDLIMQHTGWSKLAYSPVMVFLISSRCSESLQRTHSKSWKLFAAGIKSLFSSSSAVEDPEASGEADPVLHEEGVVGAGAAASPELLDVPPSSLSA